MEGDQCCWKRLVKRQRYFYPSVPTDKSCSGEGSPVSGEIDATEYPDDRRGYL